MYIPIIEVGRYWQILFNQMMNGMIGNDYRGKRDLSLLPHRESFFVFKFQVHVLKSHM